MREGRHNGHGQGGGLRGGEWIHSGHIQQTLFTSSAHNCLARPTGPVDYSSYHHDDINDPRLHDGSSCAEVFVRVVTKGKQNKRILQMRLCSTSWKPLDRVCRSSSC